MSKKHREIRELKKRRKYVVHVLRKEPSKYALKLRNSRFVVLEVEA